MGGLQAMVLAVVLLAEGGLSMSLEEPLGLKADGFVRKEKAFCVNYPGKPTRNEVSEFVVNQRGGDENNDKALDKYLENLSKHIEKKLRDAIPRKIVIPGFQAEIGSYEILVPKITLEDLSKIVIEKGQLLKDVSGEVAGIKIAGYFKEIEAEARGTLTKDGVNSELIVDGETVGPLIATSLILDRRSCSLSVGTSEIRYFQMKSTRVCRKGRLANKLSNLLSAFYRVSLLFANKTLSVTETQKFFVGTKELIQDVLDTNPVPEDLRSTSLGCIIPTTAGPSAVVPSNSPSSSAYPEESHKSSSFDSSGRVLNDEAFASVLPAKTVTVQPKAGF
ncbi:uncharacterized protein LOC135211892 [Macrobrachium nipponense]|uniref:uncharacterized protein LOC135211892 n=1 Tax=Macrobrachium nipponense TaxID=159736 RepID=UPI0030C87AF3